MKYAIKSPFFGSYLRNDGRGFSRIPLGDKTVFSSNEDALNALQSRVLSGNLVREGAQLIGVEEVPGEPKREVVELAGVVNFAGLKFALTAPFYDGQHFIGSADGTARDINFATLYDYSKDAIRAAANSTWVGINIVGIRETTTEPTYKEVAL